MHNSLSSSLAKGVIKGRAVVGSKIVADKRLSTVLVNALQHLVASGVSKTGEERGELCSDRRIGVFFEDDFVERSGSVGLGRG